MKLETTDRGGTIDKDAITFIFSFKNKLEV